MPFVYKQRPTFITCMVFNEVFVYMCMSNTLPIALIGPLEQISIFLSIWEMLTNMTIQRLWVPFKEEYKMIIGLDL